MINLSRKLPLGLTPGIRQRHLDTDEGRRRRAGGVLDTVREVDDLLPLLPAEEDQQRGQHQRDDLPDDLLDDDRGQHADDADGYQHPDRGALDRLEIDRHRLDSTGAIYLSGQAALLDMTIASPVDGRSITGRIATYSPDSSGEEMIMSAVAMLLATGMFQ